MSVGALLGLLAGRMTKEAVGARAMFAARLLNPGTARPQLQQAARAIAARWSAADFEAVPRRMLQRRGSLYQAPLDTTTAPRFAGLRRADGDVLDRVALSGRHAPALFRPSSGAYTQHGQPVTAFRSMVSGAQGPREPGITGQLPAAGEPRWWTAYPDVAAGYGHHLDFGMGGAASYVQQTLVARLRQRGPASPGFHQHVAVDTRRLGRDVVDTLPVVGGNDDWGHRPFYESVFTGRDRNVLGAHTGTEALYKLLPSGRGFQQVFSRPGGGP